jgi:hypothetical protein
MFVRAFSGLNLSSVSTDFARGSPPPIARNPNKRLKDSYVQKLILN